MRNSAKYIKLAVFVAILGAFAGCSELEELRALNRRQSITIRDQGDDNLKLREENEKLTLKLLADEEEKRKLRAELEKLATAIGQGAIVRDTIEGPVIQLQEKILFDSGMAEIKKSGKTALLTISNYLKEKPETIMRIDGHTDADPIVKTKNMWDSNHHLSAARALSVFHFLTKKEGILQERVHVSGFGPNREVAPNDTKENKKQNRRVEFLIVKGSGLE